ncbi:MAG TPA: zf-HC2 domain-containing protein [Streptosporangiaceae bacterium]
MTRVMVSASGRDGHVQMLLGAYLLGGLSAAEAAAVRTHLGRCATCRAEHDDLALVPVLLSLLLPTDWPDGLTAADDASEDRKPGE